MDSQEKVIDNEINLLELLYVLFRRKMVIIKICSLAVVASVIYSLTLPNIYSATAKVLPPQKEASGGISALIGQVGGLAGLAAGGLGGGSDLYVSILKSRSVADAVIRRLDLVKVYHSENLEAARKTLELSVNVQAGKDGVITITAMDTVPRRSAVLANTMVDELEKTTVRMNLSKAGTERLFLEKRIALVRKDLNEAENDLKSFAQKNKIVQVDAQASASIEGISRLKANLASKEVELAALSIGHTEQSPEVKAVRSAISRIKMELISLSGTGSGDGIPSVGNVPNVGLEYSRKLREVKTQEAILEQLTKQYEIAKLSEAKDSSSLQTLDEAVVPLTKAKPKRALIVIFVTVAAFAFSILVVFIQEYLERMPAEDRKIIENIKQSA